MKRNFTSLTIAVFAIALVPACEKGDGYIINHGSAELKGCAIMQIIRNNFGPVDTLVFAYNKWGDPVSINKLPMPFYMSGYNGPNYAFTYDKKHRLAECLDVEPDTLHPGTTKILERHKYFYDNPGSDNITRDSGFYYPGMVGVDFRSLTYYIYDKYDRVIKDSTFGPEVFTPTVNTYTYDGNGNRASIKYDSHTGNVFTTTFSAYDNKTNIHRTNKIWMFLDRDYSINNPFVAVSYNSKGLPAQTTSSFRFCFDTYYHEAQITYSCR